MICPYCNNNIADGYANCPSCGAAVSPQTAQAQAFPQMAPGYAGMSMAEEVNMFTAFRKYAQFEGRSRRKEYWLFVLLTILAGIVFNIIDLIIPFLGTVGQIIFNLATLIPGIAVAIRRFHDTGRSGWNYLWCLLPIVGWIIFLIYTCQDSQYGPNQYGANPKGMGNQ